MSELDKLLEGVEAEWKPLSDISEIYGGLKGKSKEDFTDGNAKYVSYKNIFNNIEVNFEILESVEVNSNENQYKVKYGDILFTGSSEIATEVGMSSAVTNKSGAEVFLNSFSFGLRFHSDIEILPEFSKYLFRSHFMRKEISKTASGVTRFNVSKKRFKKLQIPIPCPDNPEKSLKIQKEIVRILDSFTELTARKKQYSYYPDELMTFADPKQFESSFCTKLQNPEDPASKPQDDMKVEWKTLVEVAKIQRGASPRPISKFITKDKNGVPWIKIGDTVPNSKYVEQTKQKITSEGAKKSRLLKKGDLIMSNSMSFGRPYILNIDGAIHDGWASISDFGGEVNTDYIYHYLSSSIVQHFWLSKINSSSVSNLNADIIKSLKILIPPLKEQERIVNILDKFDTLTTSISEGLPKEIKLRKKQYEYYREKLLTFPKA